MLLEILICGYLNNIYSSRKIARQLTENIPFIWLSGNQTPDFRTINDFRGKRPQGRINELFANIVSEQLNKIYDLFPHIKDLLRWESFLKNIGLPDNIIRRLFNREEVKGCTGNLYSKEHSQRFHLKNGSLKLEQDKDKPENIRLTVNGTSIYDWFRQKHREFPNKLGINPPEQKNKKGMK